MQEAGHGRRDGRQAEAILYPKKICRKRLLLSKHENNAKEINIMRVPIAVREITLYNLGNKFCTLFSTQHTQQLWSLMTSRHCDTS